MFVAWQVVCRLVTEQTHAAKSADGWAASGLVLKIRLGDHSMTLSTFSYSSRTETTSLTAAVKSNW